MALASNSMLTTMFPNLHKLASISLTLPVAIASVERSFSQMKLIKTWLRNSLSESSVSHLMKIAIESPDTLTDSNLEVVNIHGIDEVEEYLCKHYSYYSCSRKPLNFKYELYHIIQL